MSNVYRGIMTTRLSGFAIALVAVATQTAPARYYNPRFSTDGTRVIFESTREGLSSVYAINVDGSGLTRLTDGRQHDAQPQWSADGSAVVYTSDVEKLSRVFVMKPDGSARRQISAGPRFDIGPAISPDNRLVAWASTMTDPVSWRDLAIAPADGSQPQKLITSGPGNDLSPVWTSPTRLVFVREVPPGTDWRALTPEQHDQRRASSELMAIDADGSKLVNLTNNQLYDNAPTWAASIKRLFFISTRNGPQELFSMNADGTDVRRIADAAGITPAISSDGRLVTYSKIVGDRSGIYVRDLGTGAEREIVGGR
jgi:TolB protein